MRIRNIECAIAGDTEASARYAKLAGSASSAKMEAYYRKCAIESLRAAEAKKHQQAARRESLAV